MSNLSQDHSVETTIKETLERFARCRGRSLGSTQCILMVHASARPAIEKYWPDMLPRCHFSDDVIETRGRDGVAVGYSVMDDPMKGEDD